MNGEVKMKTHALSSSKHSIGGRASRQSANLLAGALSFGLAGLLLLGGCNKAPAPAAEPAPTDQAASAPAPAAPPPAPAAAPEAPAATTPAPAPAAAAVPPPPPPPRQYTVPAGTPLVVR